MKLNDRSFTPLYQQVLEDLKSHITSGHYGSGDKIPSEAELSEMYSVSRVTVRRAIEELVGEGYLTSRQGKGTFVNPRKISRKIVQSGHIKSFTEICADNGMVADAHFLERFVIPTSEEHQRLFGEDCKELVYVSRVRTADGVPIMVENDYFDRETYGFMLEEDLEGVSIFDTVLKRTGNKPQSITVNTIEISLASIKLARDLDVNAGDPLFFESTFILDQDGKPLVLGNKYLVGSRYMFSL